MLVLSRHSDESIIIGDGIRVTILGVEGDKVKIGISAPRDIPILRGEVFDAIQSQDKIKLLLSEGPEPDAFKNLREMLASELLSETTLQNPPSEEMPVQPE